MRIKPGAIVDGLQAPMLVACAVVDETYLSLTGKESVFTSGKDGKHKPKSGRKSLHYDGLAGDFRTREIPPTILQRIVTRIRKKLQEINQMYQVVLEKDHLHVEFDEGE